jgi:hypothetical protein
MTLALAGLETAFDNSVFVNCPFDDKYKPLLHATLFAIHDCGFVARHALQDVGGKEQRLHKIYRLIEESRWSIHDVIRVSLSGNSKLPRFNMPFECGLAFGAMRFSGSNGRDALVLTGTRFQDKAALSDLAGIDPGYHQNDSKILVAQVRRFLAAKYSGPAKQVRGHADIHHRFEAFKARLPVAIRGEHEFVREISSFGTSTTGHVWQCFGSSATQDSSRSFGGMGDSRNRCGAGTAKRSNSIPAAFAHSETYSEATEAA